LQVYFLVCFAESGSLLFEVAVAALLFEVAVAALLFEVAVADYYLKLRCCIVVYASVQQSWNLSL